MKNIILVRSFLLALAALFIASCSSVPNSDKAVLSQTSARPVTVGQFSERTAQVQKTVRKYTPNVQKVKNLVITIPQITKSKKKRPTVKTGRVQYGRASYYARRFHGKRTASGERFNMNAMTCAHRKLPFGTHVKITNKANGRSVILRVNDRGPYAKGRIVDVSYAAAKKLGMIRSGTAKVKLEVIK